MLNIFDCINPEKETVAHCYWNNELTCENNFNCDSCIHQPADDDKPNGRKPPVKIGWDTGWTGNEKYPECPSCGEMPYSTERCAFCGQRFIQDEEIEEYNKPSPTETYPCLMCGGTVVGSRAKCNGHFSGTCQKCGARVIE